MALLRLSMLLLPSAAVALSSGMYGPAIVYRGKARGNESSIRTCALHTCPEEFELNPKNEYPCCLPLCKHYKCPEGWEALPSQQNKTYDPLVANDDRRCCMDLEPEIEIPEEEEEEEEAAAKAAAKAGAKAGAKEKAEKNKDDTLPGKE
eukprot:symbB.v1.2.013631.t1/scaffold970.1/size148061/4